MYAGNALACGELKSLKDWFLLLMEQDPSFAYFSEPTKSCFVVDEEFTHTS